MSLINVSQINFGKGRFTFPSSVFNFLGVDKPGVSIFFNGIEIKCNVPVYSTLLDKTLYRFTKEAFFSKTNFTQIEFLYNSCDTYTIFSFSKNCEYFNTEEPVDILLSTKTNILKCGTLTILNGMINVSKNGKNGEYGENLDPLYNIYPPYGGKVYTNIGNPSLLNFPTNFLVSII